MAAVTMTDSHRSRGETIGETIRRVFLNRQDFYAAAEGAALLGWSLSEMNCAIEERTVDASREGAEPRIAWREIAVALAARYPQAEIESALGPEMASVIPEPVRLTELRVQIPRYQVAMLASLARRERISIDEFMARHLLDLATSESDWLRRRVRGFEAAMRWPEG